MTLRSTLWIVLLWLAWAGPAGANEYKAATIGAGGAVGGDSTAYTYDLSFNRPEADDAPDPHVMWIIRTAGPSGTSWYLAPYATASLGNGAKVASDNINLAIPFTSVRELRSRQEGRPDTLRLGTPERTRVTTLTPISLSSDKDFATALLFARASADYYLQHKIRLRPDGTLSNVLWSVRGGVRLDGGARLSQGQRTGPMFERIVPIAAIGLGLWKYLQFKTEGEGFWLYHDPLFASNKIFGLLKSSLTLRFRGRGSESSGNPPLLPVGLTAKYTLGNDEPKYQRQNAWSIGLSFYTK